MNKRADAQAELGRMAEGSIICPGPQKYGSFWLLVRPAVRELAESSGRPRPRDSAPNLSHLEKTAFPIPCEPFRSVVQYLLPISYCKYLLPISYCIRRVDSIKSHSTMHTNRIPDMAVLWLKCMTGTYAHLKSIGIAKSPIFCSHCSDSSEAVPEFLTNFACVCPNVSPKFREAQNLLSTRCKTRFLLFEQYCGTKKGTV
jgi:hypothetical protein